ncbi:MAG: RIP metalloprotease RseP [Clostridia bacterium]|nr:RIP metalloprotease RseP [Clostridia bacterium]
MNQLLSISSIFSTVGSIILALLVLLIMITVHELGHYIVGKIFKFKINEFAIGMGPAIFKRENAKTGEVFSIRALPLGGFCAFEGEDEASDNPDAFNNKEPYKRILVLISGALMNLILGILVLILSIGIYGQLNVKTYDIRPDSNPEYAGYSLENDDVITKIDGKTIFMANDIATILNGKNKGEIVKITVNKNGKYYTRNVRLRNDVDSDSLADVFSAFTAIGVSTIEEIESVSENSNFTKGDFILRVKTSNVYDECLRIFNVNELVNYAKTVKEGEALGVYVVDDSSPNGYKLTEIEILKDLSNFSDSEILNELGIKTHKLYLKYTTQNLKFGFFETISRGVKYSVSVAGTIFRTLGELLTGKLGVDAVGGPITTISVTSNAIKEGGFNYFLEIMGFIGVNLAVFNLLPTPALDGSRVVFTAIEWIRKKPVNRKLEALIHGIGLVLLLGFSVMVDLLQLF